MQERSPGHELTYEQPTETSLRMITKFGRLSPWEFESHDENLSLSDEFFSLFELPTQEALSFEHQAMVRDALKMCAKDGVPIDLELRMMTESGPRWARIVGEAVRDSKGTIVRLCGVIKDISDRKVAELQLRREKDFSDSMINSLPGLVYLLDSEGNLLRWNENFEKVTGYSHEEVASMHQMDFFEQQDVRLVRERTDEVFSAGASDIEVNLVLKNGHRIPYLFTGFRLELDGKLCLIGMGLDISEQKRQAERVQRQLRFQKVATKISSLFVSARSTAELDDAINTTLSMLGAFFDTDRSYVFRFSEDRTRMSNTHEWCSEGTHAVIDQLQDLDVSSLPWWNRRIQESGYVHLPSISDLPDEAGVERELFLSQNIESLISVPMHGSDGHTIGFLGFDMVHSVYRWTDDKISMVQVLVGIIGNAMERLESAVALQESEARYRVAFEQSRDAIATISPPDWRFTSANPASVTLFGAQSVTDLKGLETAQLSPELQTDGRRSDEKARVMLDTALRDGSNYYEWTYRRIDGTEFPATVLLSRMQASGQTYLQCVIRDITEQKQAEVRERTLHEQMQRTQRIESIGQLTGGIAHDFNNLLTVILGNAELMRMQLNDDDALVPMASDMVRAAERGADLVRSLMAFARRQELEPAALDLNALVLGMHGLLIRTLGDHIDVQLNLSEDLPRVLVDRAQLESGLLNLCLNARDASPAGGKVVIETKALSPKYVVLSVRDQGCGIPPEHMDRILEPFFTTKTKEKGTGLGLPMVYGFVKQSGGQLDIESTPGKGTTVHLHLPVTENATSRDSITPGEVIGGNETILLVEDDDLVRKYAQDQLRSLGYSVLVAANGVEAIAIAAKPGVIDLLFTDVMMPGMSGRRLAEEMAKVRPSLPVLYTSGYAQDVIDLQALSLSEIDLLPKPYSRTELARRIWGGLRKPRKS